MKKVYIKPQMEVVALHYQQSLLNLGSSTNSNLSTEDALDIDDEEVGDGFWGR